MRSSEGVVSNTEENDQIDVCWVDHNWIKAWGLGAHNVLDYFACSQFYDLSCNNELLKMQNKSADSKNLEEMTGLEYQVDSSSKSGLSTLSALHPFLFIIVKQYRKSRSEVVKLNKYYILDKVVYQAPSLKSLFISRLSGFGFHVNNSWEFLEKAHRFTSGDVEMRGKGRQMDRSLSHRNAGQLWRFPDPKQTRAWNHREEEEETGIGGEGDKRSNGRTERGGWRGKQHKEVIDAALTDLAAHVLSNNQQSSTNQNQNAPQNSNTSPQAASLMNHETKRD